MSDREKCVVCGFPLATKTDYDAYVGARAAVTADTRVLGARCCWSECGLLHAGPAIDWHAQALEADGRAACFERVANDYKVRVEALEGALRKYGRHGSMCDVGNTGCDCGLSAALSATPQKRVKSLDEATAWLDEGDEEPGGTLAYAPPRPDATEALRVAMEALESIAGDFVPDPLEDEDDAACVARAALELLRAHVEPNNQSSKEPSHD